MGNYRAAHDLLLQTHQDLHAQKMNVPSDLSRQLLLVHSYTLVKLFLKQQDHLSAAKMLCRVSESIRSFPSHAANILTSTVIECERANLKASAYQFACELMKPQYRAEIQEQYKKKMEKVVRRTGEKKDEVDPVFVQCVFCDAKGEDTNLNCDKCLSIIPYCIATGLRVLADDFTYCPHCLFPARHSAFVARVQEDGACPMCSKELKVGDLRKCADFRKEWPRYQNLPEAEAAPAAES